MFGREAVCLDGLFVPAVFQESGFYLISLKYQKLASKKAWQPKLVISGIYKDLKCVGVVSVVGGGVSMELPHVVSK